MKDETVNLTPSSVSFSRRSVPYSYIFREDTDHSVTGVFVLYHLKRFRNAEDIVPVYIGYGNIVNELKRIEEELKFLSLSPLFFDYIANPEQPELLLNSLKDRYKPLIQ
ncbi:MAG: hypothetical protein ACHQQQ_04270 [Bacteroidota bacterium]